MKQVFLSGKGEIAVFDVPVPGHLPGAVLVRNAYSLISTGTEGAALSSRGGWLGVFEKAMQSREAVETVWKMARSQGIETTWNAVHRKLKDYLPIGYSCTGQVVELGSENMPFQPGDLVACMGGGFASHAEYVVVPVNLVARIPAGVSCQQAAFGALASIALQGIRRLELSPGEYIGVLGLGLIGQITVQLLTAMGYFAVGIDLLSERAAKARELVGIPAWGLEELDNLQHVLELTDGRGLDGVIVCAASQSHQPLNLAFDLCRKRGRVSLVGDVGLNLVRGKMFQKEIELRMSTSYGPGRYDDNYELRGRDYPLAYVRWTEKRNLEYFLELIEKGKINLTPLISHSCPVERALEGYALIKQQEKQDVYGVLIDYGPLPDQPKPLPREAFTIRNTEVKSKRITFVGKDERIKLGLIGCGNFTKAVHLPNLKRLGKLYEIAAVASRTGGSAQVIASREGIAIATSDHRVILDDPAIQAVLISTRHATHGPMAIAALEAGKHVFVEKPLCLTIAEGEQIAQLAAVKGLIVRVGFNRRFSPYLSELRRGVGLQGTRMFTCRVNIGTIGNDWSNTQEEGGRLMGEGVHFFDLCNWFMGNEPIELAAMVAGESAKTNPNVVVQVKYPENCVAQVLYTSLGHQGAGKEYFEAFGNGRSAICNDYQSLDVAGIKAEVNRKDQGNKGHLQGLEEFALAIQGKSYPIQGADARAGLLASWMALSVYESAQSGEPQKLPI